MLDELHIRDLGVIGDATLPLGPGLTVVTGETGAGKTMVVTGLLLLFGGRADSAQVRSGAASASVDGRVHVALAESDAADITSDVAGSDAADITSDVAESVAGSVAQRVADAGGELDEDGTLLLRRTVTASGRSRAHVGGAAVPVGLLAALAERLVAVHGQADQQRLTRPAEQRAALDRYAGVDLADYAVAFATWRELAARLAERRSRARELQREADLLAYGIAEIEAADPHPGEDAELAAQASRLAHVDALRVAARAAHDALLGDPDDPTSDAADAGALLGVAGRALTQQAGADAELDALAARLTEVDALVADLGAELADYAERLDADPQRLAVVQDRRAALTALTRKYGEDIDAVLAWADDARKQLAEADVSDEALAALTAERDAAGRRAATLATQLSRQRGEAAARLGEAITAELAGLAMPTARVTVQVRHRPPTTGAPTLSIDGATAAASADGVDEVELLLRPHPDAPALPVQRGASGGELSRVMLAIEVCLAGTDPVPTMVFDEVDAGVGGHAAVEVGRRLARLARDHQVIVVTHLPQVAAYAQRHVVVDKAAAGGLTRSDVREVVGTQRIAELARMLAGTESDTAREHAAELLAAAAGDCQ